MNKKYYEDKMREILERDDKTEEEAIRTAEDIMFLIVQCWMINSSKKFLTSVKSIGGRFDLKIMKEKFKSQSRRTFAWKSAAQEENE